MSDVTPEEARAALTDAGNQAAAVRRTDRQFRFILLGIAAMYLVAALTLGLYPRGGSPLAVIVLVVSSVGGSIGTLLAVLRIRAYSLRGIRWFTGSAFGFSIWNAVVVGVSIVTGWWGVHQPGFHLSISVIIAVTPLVVAAWLVGRWR